MPRSRPVAVHAAALLLARAAGAHHRAASFDAVDIPALSLTDAAPAQIQAAPRTAVGARRAERAQTFVEAR